MSAHIHLETAIPGAAPEQIYELLTNGAKFGDVTGQPGKGGGAAGAYFSLFNEWLDGRQIELVPGERISQAWRFTDWGPGVYSIVRFTGLDRNRLPVGGTPAAAGQSPTDEVIARGLWHPREIALLIEKFTSGAVDLRPQRPSMPQ
jgi:hypothetical protein